MPVTAFLKIDDIEGEATYEDHEDEIEIHDVEWNIEQATQEKPGRGRTRSRAEVSSLVLRKNVDAASVHLALACMQGKSYPSAVLSVANHNGNQHFDYLSITLENVTIAQYQVLGTGKTEGDRIEEMLGLNFEEVTYKYIVEAADGSAGQEHEITYDIAAGI